MFLFNRLVKDVVKALKKRIGHKNPKVQILALSVRMRHIFTFNYQLCIPWFAIFFIFLFFNLVVLMSTYWHVLPYILQLLESMIKECGEVVHAFVAEREVLKEMVKIAKKKVHFHSTYKMSSYYFSFFTYSVNCIFFLN